MVGSGSAHAAAVEERRKKLQEYLAAKGKLRCANAKPYLREQKQHSRPLASLSTTRQQNDPIKQAQRPAARQPTGQGLQPGSSDVRGTQRPKAAAPDVLGKGPVWGCLSSRPLGPPSGHPHPQHLPKAAPRPVGTLPRMSGCSHKTQNAARPRIPKQMEPACELHAGDQLVGDVSEETDKENRPSPVPAGSERRPQARLRDAAGPKGGSGHPSRRGLGLVDGGATRSVLKEQSHRLFVHESHAGLPKGKSHQRLPSGAVGERPKAREPRMVSAQSLARTWESKKGITEKEAMRGHRGEQEGYGAKLPAPRRSRPQMKPPVLPVGKLSGQQHLQVAQPKATRKPLGRAGQTLQMGSPSKALARAPPRKQPQSLASKAKRTVSWNCSVKCVNPKAQPYVHLTKPPTAPDPGGTEAADPCLEPRTQQKRCGEDRRKKLEEWLASKGKTYKRPPMKFLAQTKKVQKLNHSFWKSMEEEEETQKVDPDLSHRISSTLAECLKLIEEGAHSEEILAILSGIPQAEKFSTFWICKARLLAEEDIEAVMGLYEAAVRCGATPIRELRDVILDILKSAKKTPQGISREPDSAEERAEAERPPGSIFRTPRERIPIGAAPGASQKGKDHPSLPCIKLQITPLPRAPGMPEAQDVKLVTPVRRSLRIEHAQPQYPDRLREHGMVVASLGQLPQVAQADCYIYCKNEALPEDTELWLFAS
ncbi:cytoskeleton-associated protein 2-like [Gracilinanus agilis]|uniref:cytoskeleton-associated protein 2-like n=1 Tax=Gracilinanus agilis TaxID=191870 RepID=UPI001CFF137C|nr:cytoskeleton-associated protein 2-like [Gracilinanus agilis]